MANRLGNLLARRGFLAGLTATIAGIVAAVLGVPLAGYTILPALRRRAEMWAEVGAVADLVPNHPRELKVFQTISDGWLKTTVPKSVWAVKQGSGEVVVYSGLCPHLGCGFRWETERRVFLCPCHLSLFALDGHVLSGPSPRPLDTLPAKISKGRLLVTYKEFRAGTTAKNEL